MSTGTRKMFVLDTNVILHDSSCIRHFEDNDVVTSYNLVLPDGTPSVFDATAIVPDSSIVLSLDIDITTGSMDHPEAYPPDSDYFVDERLPYVPKVEKAD